MYKDLKLLVSYCFVVAKILYTKENGKPYFSFFR